MKSFLAVLLTGFIATSAMSQEAVQQDSAKAMEYFKNELEFRLNPFGLRYEMKENGKNLTVIDVRAAHDYNDGHIPGAVNMPWDQYNNFQGDEKDFPGLKKDGYNYIYCYAEGCPIGPRAAIKFASLGYPVREIAGGWEAWKTSGLPIEKTKAKTK